MARMAHGGPLFPGIDIFHVRQLLTNRRQVRLGGAATRAMRVGALSAAPEPPCRFTCSPSMQGATGAGATARR